MTKIVPSLWKESLKLKKETYFWKERKMRITEKKGENTTSYIASKATISESGMYRATTFSKDGGVLDTIERYMENPNLEVTKSNGRIFSTDTYDDNENLTVETFINHDGPNQETFYTYDDDNFLVKIEEKNEGILIEELIYQNDKLSQILSKDNNGEVLMERKMLYDFYGRLEEVHRIQEKTINQRVFYFYNSENKLILKEVETISRLTGNVMPPSNYKYDYHENGILKEEKSTDYIDETREDKKFEISTVYNELGLEIQGTYIDFRKNEKEITTYEYKMSNKK